MPKPCFSLFLLLTSVLLYSACATDIDSSNATKTSSFPVPTGEWQQVIPAATLPSGVTTDISNNNLDAIEFDGQIYLAFRTAPSHFASDETLIHVLRTTARDDVQNWKLELTVHTGKDLREPRMFVLNGKLFLYISELGTAITAFEPGRVFGLARDKQGIWSPPKTVFDDGTIVWRTKTRNGKVYMTGYTGGENIYQEWTAEHSLSVLFMTTADGWHWQGVNPDKPVVVTGGLSETGFEFDLDGNLWAVLRNEAGDETGFGSRLCKADKADLADWTCTPRSDPHKYDSPFMFRYKNLMYLIARYNPGGPYDLAPDEPISFQRFMRNEIRYSTTAKRTALYGYNTDKMAIELVDIFPSSGDTAFASGVWLEQDKRLLVFNYSSDLDAPDTTWIEGQALGSQIYAAILSFE